MESLRDNYRRAAYADYPKTEIKNKFATVCRLLCQQYKTNDSSKDNIWAKNCFGLIVSSLAIETIFYLPNHFR